MGRAGRLKETVASRADQLSQRHSAPAAPHQPQFVKLVCAPSAARTPAGLCGRPRSSNQREPGLRRPPLPARRSLPASSSASSSSSSAAGSTGGAVDSTVIIWIPASSPPSHDALTNPMTRSHSVDSTEKIMSRAEGGCVGGPSTTTGHVLLCVVLRGGAGGRWSRRRRSAWGSSIYISMSGPFR